MLLIGHSPRKMLPYPRCPPLSPLIGILLQNVFHEPEKISWVVSTPKVTMMVQSPPWRVEFTAHCHGDFRRHWTITGSSQSTTIKAKAIFRIQNQRGTPPKLWSYIQTSKCTALWAGGNTSPLGQHTSKDKNTEIPFGPNDKSGCSGPTVMRWKRILFWSSGRFKNSTREQSLSWKRT